MFAIFLSEKMDVFYQNIGSFPTLIYSILLVVIAIYWAGAVLGIVDLDMDFLDLNFIDLDVDAPDVSTESTHSTPDVLAGLMLRYGLVGVPITVSLSVLVIVGWLLCYYAVHFLFGFIPGSMLKFIAGIPVLIASLYFSAHITGVVIKPLRPLFATTTQRTEKLVLGQTAIVRTSRVDNNFGEAELDDGGAGLILKVRSTGSDRFEKGDRVVLFEKLDKDNIYRVISEKEFAGL